MFEQHYLTMYVSNGQWRKYGGDEHTVKCTNPLTAGLLAASAREISDDGKALTVKVTIAETYDIATRTRIMTTTYEGVNL